MINIEQLINIICTEAVEYGGLQEIPAQKHGARSSFHSSKRESRNQDMRSEVDPVADEPSVIYSIRLEIKSDGQLKWED